VSFAVDPSVLRTYARELTDARAVAETAKRYVESTARSARMRKADRSAAPGAPGPDGGP